jgi:hypothetical protein
MGWVGAGIYPLSGLPEGERSFGAERPEGERGFGVDQSSGMPGDRL